MDPQFLEKVDRFFELLDASPHELNQDVVFLSRARGLSWKASNRTPHRGFVRAVAIALSAVAIAFLVVQCFSLLSIRQETLRFFEQHKRSLAQNNGSRPTDTCRPKTLGIALGGSKQDLEVGTLVQQPEVVTSKGNSDEDFFMLSFGTSPSSSRNAGKRGGRSKANITSSTQDMLPVLIDEAELSRQLKRLSLSFRDMTTLTFGELVRILEAKLRLKCRAKAFAGHAATVLKEKENLKRLQSELDTYKQDGQSPVSRKDRRKKIDNNIAKSQKELLKAQSSMRKLRASLRGKMPDDKERARTLLIRAERRAKGKSLSHAAAAALSTAELILFGLSFEVKVATSEQAVALRDIVQELVQQVNNNTASLKSLRRKYSRKKGQLPQDGAWKEEAEKAAAAAAAVAEEAARVSLGLRYVIMEDSSVLAETLERANLSLRKAVDEVANRFEWLEWSGDSLQEKQHR